MDTSTNIITTMGIISNEVYNTTPGKDYFNDNPDLLVANNHTYKVLDHTPDSNTSGWGMEALLLQEMKVDANGNILKDSEGNELSTGKFVVAFRGTEKTSILDLFNDLATIPFKNWNTQYNSAVEFVNKYIGQTYNGVTLTKDNLTLTGHSLGGILTQQVGATMHIKGYAYNPWGSNVLAKYPPNGTLNIIARMLEALGIYTPTAEQWAKENIVNISYQDDGSLNGDILSNLLTGIISKHLGDFIPIYGNNVGLSGHSIELLNRSIKHYNEVLKHFNNTDYQMLSDIYMLKGYEKTEEIFNNLGIYHANNLTLDFLANKPLSSLTSKSKANIYALIHVNPFSIEGNLPAYDDIDPDDYSDVYIEKRAELLYYDYHKNQTTDYYADLQRSITVNNPSTVAAHSHTIFGGDANNIIAGDQKDDYLFGENGNDILQSFSGNDYLDGGKGADTLEGGSGFDTYIAGDGDTVKDSDGKGQIFFENEALGGGTYNSSKGVYEAYNGTYTLQDNTLVFTNNQGKKLIIDNYHKENSDLGIKLSDEKIVVGVKGGVFKEGNSTPQKGTITITLSKPFKKDTIIITNHGKIEVKAGETTAKLGIHWNGNTNENKDIKFNIKIEKIETKQDDGTFIEDKNDFTIGSEGEVTILDDDKEELSKKDKEGHPTDYNPFKVRMADPLVLDMNKDGKISTVDLNKSEVYFDLTGDGTKERTSWIKGEDALLVYDKNEDGKISGIDEVFGNSSKSGFDELRDVADSNYDNKIDRRDILFNRLQIWHDYNQDDTPNPCNKVTNNHTNSKNIINHSINHHIFITEPDKIDKNLKYLNNPEYKEKRLVS